MHSLDNFHQATAKALLDSRNDVLRPGQLYMNMLHMNRPDLWNRITGTKIDPFYDDQRITEFWAYLRDNW